MDLLEINPDTVCRLVELAREFHAQEQVVIGEEPGSLVDDWPTQILAAHAEDLSLAEFRSIVDDLYPDQQLQVVALMWLGRGDFDLDDWQKTLDEARHAWTPHTADYLIAHPLLADYLIDGLELHGHRCD